METEEKLDEKVYNKLVKKHADAFVTASHNVDAGAWPWMQTVAWLAPQLGVGHRTAELALRCFRNDEMLGTTPSESKSLDDDMPTGLTTDGKSCYWDTETGSWHYTHNDRKVTKRKAPAPPKA